MLFFYSSIMIAGGNFDLCLSHIRPHRYCWGLLGEIHLSLGNGKQICSFPAITVAVPGLSVIEKSLQRFPSDKKRLSWWLTIREGAGKTEPVYMTIIVGLWSDFRSDYFTNLVCSLFWGSSSAQIGTADAKIVGVAMFNKTRRKERKTKTLQMFQSSWI